MKMAFILQSRFAGLQIDDDDELQRKPRKPKINATKKSEPAKKVDVGKNTKTAKAQGGSGDSQPIKKKKKKPSMAQEEQWQSWKSKDSEMVDEHFVEDLEKAIYLSKLDYEKAKIESKNKKPLEISKSDDTSPSVKDDSLKTDPSKSKKKNKGKKIMSLEQFNDLGKKVEEDNFLPDEDNLPNGSPRKKNQASEKEFFESVDEDLKKEIQKEKGAESFRERQKMSDEVLSRIQLIETLEKKDQEVLELRKEVEKLKEDLHTVKTRNRKLCQILGQGEMKDKAVILVEVEKLRSVQEELTQEVETLNAQLQQERSAKSSDFKQKKKQNAADKEK